MICVPLTGSTTEKMLTGARRAAELGADMVEFRLDFAADPDIPQLVASTALPAIFTCRPKREGGYFEGPEDERIALLQQAVDAGADYVDVELDSVDKLRRNDATKTIVSVHDLEKTPDDLDSLYDSIAATNPDVVKIVTTATDVTDNLRLFELLEKATLPTIALAMGERGVISRILAGRFGGFLTFASLEKGKGSAPGQLTIDELLNLYRYRKIDKSTRLFGVVSKPVAHSMSPLIHNTAFEERGLNCVYLPFLVDNVTDFIAKFRGLPVAGYSVTLPHKEEAFRNADEMDELTRRIGSLNTLVVREGKLFGTNTDCSAALGAMEEALGGIIGGVSPLAGKNVALIGARGTARAVGFGLVDAGARVTIFNRTVEKAEALAGELGCEWAPLDKLPEATPDVIANTTSVGMHPNVDASVVPTSLLRKGVLVFDAVYNPIETKLIREARARGCLTVTGLKMFVRQAAQQFELFTNAEPPIDTMRKVVEKRLGH